MSTVKPKHHPFSFSFFFFFFVSGTQPMCLGLTPGSKLRYPLSGLWKPYAVPEIKFKSVTERQMPYLP